MAYLAYCRTASCAKAWPYDSGHADLDPVVSLPILAPVGRQDVDEDECASLRNAAGCFKRKITLLRSLNRFSAPLPDLDIEVGDVERWIC